MTVLGFTGNEVPVVSKFNTFCNLCSRQIRVGEECLQDNSDNGKVKRDWFYHLDCVISRITAQHVVQFKDAKVKKRTTRTNKIKPKVRQGDGTKTCFFCSRLIDSHQTYVLKDRRPLHNVGVRASKAKSIVGRPSCMSRYNRTIEGLKSSI